MPSAFNGRWRLLCCALAIGAFWTGIQPAAAFSGITGASFLDIPVGGRPAALGGAYSSEAADAYAPIYNPGGLGLLDTTQLAGMHIAYLDSINYEYATFVHPLAIGHSLGVSAQVLLPGQTTERDVAGNLIGTFSGHYGAYSLAYGAHLGSHAGLGFTGKYIESDIAGVCAHAYGFDAGALYRPNARWSLGAVLANVGSKLTYVEQADALPMAGHLGLTYAPSKYFLLTSEGVYEKSASASWHGGVEWNPVDLLSLRLGYRTDMARGLSPMAGLTTGLGIHVFGQEFDYAWVPIGELGNAQYFSLVLRFSHANREKRDLIYLRNHERPAGDHDNALYEPPLPDMDTGDHHVTAPPVQGSKGDLSP